MIDGIDMAGRVLAALILIAFGGIVGYVGGALSCVAITFDVSGYVIR